MEISLHMWYIIEDWRRYNMLYIYMHCKENGYNIPDGKYFGIEDSLISKDNIKNYFSDDLKEFIFTYFADGFYTIAGMDIGTEEIVKIMQSEITEEKENMIYNSENPYNAICEWYNNTLCNVLENRIDRIKKAVDLCKNGLLETGKKY